VREALNTTGYKNIRENVTKGFCPPASSEERGGRGSAECYTIKGRKGGATAKKVKGRHLGEGGTSETASLGLSSGTKGWRKTEGVEATASIKGPRVQAWGHKIHREYRRARGEKNGRRPETCRGKRR